MKFDILQAGYCSHLECLFFKGGAFGPQKMPARVGLIRHPEIGNILIDTAYSPHFFKHTRRFPAKLYRQLLPVTLGADGPIEKQLRSRFGISPAEIGHILLTHFHADHIGGLPDFPTAKIHCLREAHASTSGLRGIPATAVGFVPALCPADLQHRLTYIDAEKKIIPLGFSSFPEGYDWSGDGRIVIVPLPGHAPGHCGVLLNDPSWPRPVFFVGDAAWSKVDPKEYKELRLLSLLFQHNRPEYLATLSRLFRLHREHPEIEIICCHQDGGS